MALPHYPQLKTKLEAAFVDIMQDAARQELGPFADVQHFIQHEGEVLKHNTLDDESKEKTLTYQTASVEYKVLHADIPSMSLEDVIKLMIEKGKEFGGQQARYNYQVINRVTEETGNVVDGGGKPMTIDLFLEVFEKIQIAFDKDGNPEMPTMVINPQMSESARRVMEEAERPENKKRFDEIMARKKKEWDEEQSRRKLVD